MSGTNDTQVRDVIIVGSGPSGYTAAIYAARANLSPLVFEGSITAGGALMNTTEVENFPGFPDGIMGPELMENLRTQAERFGAELVAEDIVSMDLTGEVKTVTDGYGNSFRARAVILSMGSSYRKLGVPDEDRLSGHGVSWCATCDGFFFRDKDIAVVGGGDSAIEEATFLTRFARSVTLRDTVDGSERELEVSGLFIAIGHDPRSELVHGQVHLDGEGYVLTDGKSTRTNLPGVFAAGDLVDHTYRQAITAAGTGCSAALDAERYLADLEDLGEAVLADAQSQLLGAS